MTVKDLIKQLSDYPDNFEVMVRSYELGYDQASELKTLELTSNPTDNEYEGNFIPTEDRENLIKGGWSQHILYPIKETEKTFKALVIIGDSRE